jgi:ribosome-associated protein
MAEPDQGIDVLPGLVIPEAELELRRTRSGGPGGQNVNKSNTRVEIHFDLARSAVLDAEQKRRIQRRLATRISQAGVLRVVAQASRSQAQNEAAARGRLAELLRAALYVAPARRRTRPSAGAAAKRREGKQRRSRLKSSRRPPRSDD